MKYLVYLNVIFIFVLFTDCIHHKTKESKLEVKIYSIVKLNNKTIGLGQGLFYTFKIELKNNTNTEISYWTMSCSWEDNWIFSSDEICFYNQGCDHNWYILKKIKSGEKESFTSIIQLKDSMDCAKKDFKLGFILIEKNEVYEKQDFFSVLFRKKKDKRDIVWSEPFKINNPR